MLLHRQLLLATVAYMHLHWINVQTGMCHMRKTQSMCRTHVRATDGACLSLTATLLVALNYEGLPAQHHQ
jgi:hypothetical protein